MKIEEMNDLQLAEILNQTWSRMVQVRNNLDIIQQEIRKRKEVKLNEPKI